MHQEDLSDRLNSFSISSNEEKLTQALDRTHIGSSASPFIFNLAASQPSPQSQPQSQPQQQPQQQPIYYSGDLQNKSSHVDNNKTFDWDPAATKNWKSEAITTTAATTSQLDDGWGEGAPSYTATTQGTYFGFNSIIESQDHRLAVCSPQLDANVQTVFSRYKNAPVSFVAAANNNNNKQ